MLSGNSFTSISVDSEAIAVMMPSVASFAYEGHERGLCFGDFGLRVLSPSVVVELLLLAKQVAADVAHECWIPFFIVLVVGIVLTVIVMDLTAMMVEVLLPSKCLCTVRATMPEDFGYRYLALVHI